MVQEGRRRVLRIDGRVALSTFSITCHWEDKHGEEDNEDENEDEAGDNQLIKMARHYVGQILRNGRPLVPGVLIADDDPMNILKKHLVDTASFERVMFQLRFYHELQCIIREIREQDHQFWPRDDREFRSFLKGLKEDSRKEMRELQQKDLLGRRRRAISRLSKHAPIQIPMLAQEMSPEREAAKWSEDIAEELVAHPELFQQKFANWMPGMNRQLAFQYVCRRIKLDFRKYRAMNPHLMAYDAKIEGCLASVCNNQKFSMEMEFSESGRHNEHWCDGERRELRSAIAYGRLTSEARHVFNDNDDPLTKCDRLCEFFMSPMPDLYQYEILRRPDDWQPIRTGDIEVFCTECVIPSCLASIYGYINDFVGRNGLREAASWAWMDAILDFLCDRLLLTLDRRLLTACHVDDESDTVRD